MEDDAEDEKAVTPTKEDATPTKGVRKSREEKLVTETARIDRRSRKGSGKLAKVGRRPSLGSGTSPPPLQPPSTHGALTPGSEFDSVYV